MHQVYRIELRILIEPAWDHGPRRGQSGFGGRDAEGAAPAAPARISVRRCADNAMAHPNPGRRGGRRHLRGPRELAPLYPGVRGPQRLARDTGLPFGS